MIKIDVIDTTDHTYVMVSEDQINDEEKETDMDQSTVQLKLEELEKRIEALEREDPKQEPRKLSESDESAVGFLLGDE